MLGYRHRWQPRLVSAFVQSLQCGRAGAFCARAAANQTRAGRNALAALLCTSSRAAPRAREAGPGDLASSLTASSSTPRVPAIACCCPARGQLTRHIVPGVQAAMWLTAMPTDKCDSGARHLWPRRAWMPKAVGPVGRSRLRLHTRWPTASASEAGRASLARARRRQGYRRQTADASTSCCTGRTLRAPHCVVMLCWLAPSPVRALPTHQACNRSGNSMQRWRTSLRPGCGGRGPLLGRGGGGACCQLPLFFPRSLLTPHASPLPSPPLPSTASSPPPFRTKFVQSSLLSFFTGGHGHDSREDWTKFCWAARTQILVQSSLLSLERPGKMWSKPFCCHFRQVTKEMTAERIGPVFANVHAGKIWSNPFCCFFLQDFTDMTAERIGLSFARPLAQDTRGQNLV